MENVGIETNNEGDHDTDSNLKIKISELERELRDEKDRFTVLESKTEVEKFVARQEVEKYRRDCSSLEDRVARLEEDCNILRERVLRDQEKIRVLLEEIETKEMEFKEKFIELKVENRDLECGKRRAQDEVDEWRKKYFELEAEKSRRAKNNGAEVDDELQKGSEEGFVLTPERKRSRGFVEGHGESEGEGGCDDEDGGEKENDGVPIGQFRKKRRVEEAADGVEKASDSSLNQSHGRRGASGNHSGSKGIAAGVAEAQTPLLPAISDQEDLRISRNSKSLLEVAKSKSKSLTRNRRPRLKKKFKAVSSRRSSTAKKSVTSDCNGVSADLALQPYLKRSADNQKRQREYTGRVASSEQRDHALRRAEEIQRNLNFNHPSFVRSVTRSNVSTCFWLGFPPKFCEENLPPNELRMVIEDEKGTEHKVSYSAGRGGLGGGWKAFASGRNLEIGDALVFELSEPERFKVHVIKANPEESTEGIEVKIAEENTDGIIKAADTNNVNGNTAEGDTNCIIKQYDANIVEARRIPVRFRLVKRSPQKLDL